MVRFLLTVAMTCAIGAAGLGFFNREKVNKLTAGLTTESERSSEAQALTVSLGSDIGLTPKSRLKVEKNGEVISELRVVSVDKNSSTAEFLSNGPENFARVSVGDPVVFTKR